MIIRQIINAGVAITTGKIINAITILLFNIILVRVLLKEDVGNYFLTFSIVGFFTLLATFGAGNIAIRWFSEIVNQVRKVSALSLLYSFLMLNLLTALISVVLFLLLDYFHIIEFLKIDYNANLLVTMGLWIWCQSMLVILTELFRAFGKFVKTMLTAGVLLNTINLLIILTILVLDQVQSFNNIVLLVAANTVLVNLLAFGLAIKTCREYDSPHQVDERSTITNLSLQIFIEALPSFINKLGLYLIVVADIWLISAFFNKTTLADYGIAVKVASALSIFLAIANGFVPTFIGRLKVKGEKTVELFLRTVATLAALPTVALFLLLFFWPTEIINLVFGESYKSAASILTILLLPQLANVLVGSCSYTLVMEGKNTELMKISLFTSVLTIVSALICIYLEQGVISIVWVFSLAAILRYFIVYGMAVKICNINTAVYMNPILLAKNIKLILAKSKNS